MSLVNPPPQLRIPKAFQGDREIFEYFRAKDQILFQLWVRTGGSDDVVESTANESIDTDALFALIGRFDDLAFRDVFTVSSDHTTSGREIVICNDAVTVTLHDEPDDQEIVTINRQAGAVKISGNGKLINGASEVKMKRKYMSFDIIYTAETDEWAVI